MFRKQETRIAFLLGLVALVFIVGGILKVLQII